MKTYKLYRYIFSQLVSLLLVLAAIVLLINYFVMDWNVSGFLALMILNAIYHIIENAKLFKKLADNGIDIRQL